MTITIVHQTNGQNGTNGTSTVSNGDTARQTSGAAKLRKMLNETNDLIVCPGVYDGLSARIALSLGFEAMYMVRDVQQFLKLHLTITDRCWNDCLATGKGRSGTCPAVRYEDQRGDDSSSGTIWTTLDCRHGHGIRWYGLLPFLLYGS